ncbi:MAG TPA: ABC transporter permease, partial [Povalibacter sp.]
MQSPAAVLLDAGVFGPLRHAPVRTVLAMIAIAFGVALGLAIYLINRVAADEVAAAAHSLFGQADLAVEGASDDFDEALYPVVARLPGVHVASPVVQVEAKLIGQRGALTLLGMDVFRSQQLQPAFARAGATANNGAAVRGEPVFLSASAARWLGKAAGDVVRVQVGLSPVEFTVAGVMPAAALEGRVAIIDIATAQWRFERLGKLSRLNLRVTPGVSAALVRERLSRVLPPGTTITVPGQAASDAARLSRAYRSNLTALALVALFTGGFFVYSTQSLATLRRRREFALLHALGVTRSQQFMLMMFGGAIIGAVGAAFGIAGGVALAQTGVSLLGADLGAGYFRGATPLLQMHAAEAVFFCVLGMLVAIGGSVQPALEAARVPTASALKAGDIGGAGVRSHGLVAVAMFVLAIGVVGLPAVAGLPLPGYVAIALLIVGTVVAMPSVLRVLLARAPQFDAVPWEMAVAHLRGTAR